MFGLVKRKELNELKEEFEERFGLHERRQDDMRNELNPLKIAMKQVCTHVKVKEIVRKFTGYFDDSIYMSVPRDNFECMACGEKFVKKPKDSKISRMKEVLSDK